MKARRLLDDCFLHDKDRLRHDDALGLLLSRLSPIAENETVSLDAALNRVLAEDIMAPRNVPTFTNAAVDGYAVAHASLSEGESRLPVTLRCAAGHPVQTSLGAGEAARIFTGAVMPDGADTCIMQEDCEVDGDVVIIPAGVKPGINTRKAGEDVAAGSTVVGKGTRLRPQELAAIASTGAATVSVFNPLKVALVSTGDEVIRPGHGLGEGQVYDSNHFLLRGLLGTVGAEITDLGILPDDRGSVRKALTEAAQVHDVILTTGGASRGETDFIVETIETIGTLTAWQLAIKPGRPLAFGQMGDTVFLGLPGNPVAVFVCFLLYAQPMFAKLQGMNWLPPRRFPLPAGFSIPKKKPDRREFWRGWVEEASNGARLKKFDRDGSALISGLTRAEGLIEIAEEITGVNEGDMLSYIPFSEFGL